MYSFLAYACNVALFSKGKLEMWVEMYPKDQPLPTVALDISPRKPERWANHVYEVTVAIVVRFRTISISGIQDGGPEREMFQNRPTIPTVDWLKLDMNSVDEITGHEWRKGYLQILSWLLSVANFCIGTYTGGSRYVMGNYNLQFNIIMQTAVTVVPRLNSSYRQQTKTDK